LYVPLAKYESLELSSHEIIALGADANALAFLVVHPPTGRIDPSCHLTKLASLHLFDA